MNKSPNLVRLFDTLRWQVLSHYLRVVCVCVLLAETHSSAPSPETKRVLRAYVYGEGE